MAQLIVWCLPGMEDARLLMINENKVMAENFNVGQLLDIRDGIDEALIRICTALCDKHGHKLLINDCCARCGRAGLTRPPKLDKLLA